ncbi:MAG: restriction endonuclease [Clostridia bacterium]|nr:restriction endonuclease [Clostridia bacterium]
MSIFDFWKKQNNTMNNYITSNSVGNQISETNQILYKKELESYNYSLETDPFSKDEEFGVLKIFATDMHFFEQFVIPTILLAQKYGFSEEQLKMIVLKAHRLLKVKKSNSFTLEAFINNEKNKYNFKLIRTLSHSFYSAYNKNSLAIELREFGSLKLYNILHCLHRIDEVGENLQATITTTLHKNKANEVLIRQWLEFDFVMTFLRILYYLEYQNIISPKLEYSKLLALLFIEKKDYDKAEYAAYEYLIEEGILNREEKGYIEFIEFNKIFNMVTRPGQGEEYNEYMENTTIMNYEKSLDELIEDTKFIYYNKEKLVRAKITTKLKKEESLYTIFTDIYKIQYLTRKIENAKTRQSLIKEEKKNQNINIDLLSGIEFENFLCLLFEKDGYICQKTKATGDQGIDIIATKDDSVVAIQAKRYSSAVGNHAIMEAVAGKNYYNANTCMVITNNVFTNAAIELARANNVILWDRKELLNRMQILEEN